MGGIEGRDGKYVGVYVEEYGEKKGDGRDYIETREERRMPIRWLECDWGDAKGDVGSTWGVHGERSLALIPDQAVIV